MRVRAPAPTYRHVAWCYDALASAYSLGAIGRAKAAHLAFIEPGMRVLYAGAGSGREIAGACERGAEVTCVEACPSMAVRLHDRLAEHGERFAVIPRPIQQVAALPEYDLVVAHFFLNVFDTQTMPGVLEHLCGFVGPGGKMVIADFKPASNAGGLLNRALRSAYYRPVNLAGRLLGICALHPVYDYGPKLEPMGFWVRSRTGFQPLPGLPAFYESMVAWRAQ